jgi:hypothetical protein
MFLDYFALGLLVFVFVVIFYAIIAVHDIPYEIAKHRNHPHQDAIHAAGWVSLLTLHVLWPFLWIWAMTYRPERGWGFSWTHTDQGKLNALLESYEQRLKALERTKTEQELEVPIPPSGEARPLFGGIPRADTEDPPTKTSGRRTD